MSKVGVVGYMAAPCCERHVCDGGCSGGGISSISSFGEIGVHMLAIFGSVYIESPGNNHTLLTTYGRRCSVINNLTSALHNS